VYPFHTDLQKEDGLSLGHTEGLLVRRLLEFGYALSFFNNWAFLKESPVKKPEKTQKRTEFPGLPAFG
jgi:hypothetical protein